MVRFSTDINFEFAAYNLDGDHSWGGVFSHSTAAIEREDRYGGFVAFEERDLAVAGDLEVGFGGELLELCVEIEEDGGAVETVFSPFSQNAFSRWCCCRMLLSTATLLSLAWDDERRTCFCVGGKSRYSAPERGV